MAAELADLLEQEAEIFGDHFDDVVAWVGGHCPDLPRRIADLGAGVGAWSRILAHRFAPAELLAVDRSDQMLARMRQAHAVEGWGSGVRAVEADLEAGWPAGSGLDLVWTASLLHELADPGAVLRQTHAALRSGGLLAVVELAGLPSFLPRTGQHPVAASLEPSRGEPSRWEPGLEARCHAALRAAGWNHYPDWSPHLEDAGFELVERRTFHAAPDPGARRGTAGALARNYLRRMRAGVDGRIPAEDLRSLDAVLEAGGPSSLERRDDLAPHAARTVWLARRP